ncbi:FHA domain-containing protein [Pseudanabaenaceae cyanobacterium LEGE 13415]|nr:FHA domain-containing protein [Pseudanabaenaceae cyanobacterium LEGE 13415]
MPVTVTLFWNDPVTEAEQEIVAITPIAIGRSPETISAQGIPERQHVILNSLQVSRFHASIDWKDRELIVTDQGSSNGVLVNGRSCQSSTLSDGDVVQIGPFQITVLRTQFPSRVTTVAHSPAIRPQSSFPPAWFIESDRISLSDLAREGKEIEQLDFAAIGGGLGSYIWADLLRLSGIRADQIRVLGKVQFDETGNIRPDANQKPYWNYKQLCEFSQIPAHERLRSNSDSCPDNIWGFPSYALREAWTDFSKGDIGHSLKLLWQVFAEPTGIETYTPRSGRVFDSIDRETQRVGWHQMFRYGDVRAIRKTNDDRYVIAYSRSSVRGADYRYLVARYVHVAIGYPALRYLPLVTAYREKTKEAFHDRLVVNAYEDHQHVYQKLRSRGGGIIILQGRGIVASRIIQRVYEMRQQEGCKIQLIHMIRSPVPQGHRYQTSQRIVKNHQELQPFNWPKACWGGELREKLENANPEERKRLLSDWGGTTTADRRDWQEMIDQGIRSGWYRILFGEIKDLRREGDHLRIDTLEKAEGRITNEQMIKVDFLIDATGLTNEIQFSPLLKDLVLRYKLELNPTQRLSVSNAFEINGMRNGTARMYAAGAMTLGGPYAAVDSFLGLQYAAIVAVDDLQSANVAGLKGLNGLRSFGQWMRWVQNQAP